MNKDLGDVQDDLKASLENATKALSDAIEKHEKLVKTEKNHTQEQKEKKEEHANKLRLLKTELELLAYEIGATAIY